MPAVVAAGSERIRRRLCGFSRQGQCAFAANSSGSRHADCRFSRTTSIAAVTLPSNSPCDHRVPTGSPRPERPPGRVRSGAAPFFCAIRCRRSSVTRTLLAMERARLRRATRASPNLRPTVPIQSRSQTCDRCPDAGMRRCLSCRLAAYAGISGRVDRN